MKVHMLSFSAIKPNTVMARVKPVANTTINLFLNLSVVAISLYLHQCEYNTNKLHKIR